MISSKEYKQLLEFFTINSSYILNYSIKQNINTFECLNRLDELRLLHLKYKKECDSYNLYPHLNLDKLNLLKKDIEEFCLFNNLDVIFYNKSYLSFKKGIHCSYKFIHIDITNLIIFSK